MIRIATAKTTVPATLRLVPVFVQLAGKGMIAINLVIMDIMAWAASRNARKQAVTKLVITSPESLYVQQASSD